MSNLADMFESKCQVFEDDENLASVGTTLAFWDEDPVCVFAEQAESGIRIFDDGIVVMHMLGSGINLRDESLVRAIRNIGELEGVSLNAEGEFEVWAETSEISDAFARYMSALVALLTWESVEVERMSTPPAKSTIAHRLCNGSGRTRSFF